MYFSFLSSYLGIPWTDTLEKINSTDGKWDIQ